MKPVEQFVLEKLAVPVWLRKMTGFVKGKPWQAWSGEARAAGKARARQHVARKAIRESEGFARQGLHELAAKARAPMSGAISDIGPLVRQIQDPRMRQLLTARATQRNLWMDPLMRTTPSMRLREGKRLMEGPLQMGQRQAVRSAAGIGKPMPFPQPSAPRFAPDRFLPHVVPPKGQTGVFRSMYERAPTSLQQSPRFQEPLAVVRARGRGPATGPMSPIQVGRSLDPQHYGYSQFRLGAPTHPTGGGWR